MPDWPQSEVPFLEQFTATDDRGTSYRMRIRDLGGGYDGWTLMLHPDPPYDPRWVDLAIIAGQPATRIDLSPSTRPPAGEVTTVSAATASPVRPLAACRVHCKPDCGGRMTGDCHVRS